jgi:radical SAM protein with 4Fe4S-binding SPASM domain
MKNPIDITQLLSFEISTECNLKEIHKNICPIGKREKTGRRRLNGNKILSVLKDAYDLGFGGYITFHYYNEPMVTAYKMFKLMDSIRNQHPQSRFFLWTNGTILIKDRHLQWFEKTYVSNYFHIPAEVLGQFFSGLIVGQGNDHLDSRLFRSDGEITDDPCQMVLHELPINNQGDAHLCCYDWRNEVKLGNVFDDSLEQIAERKWKIAKTIIHRMDDTSPAVCRSCKFKRPMFNFDSDIYSKALERISRGNDGAS